MRDAAARLLITDGPDAITHRRVAMEAGVPAGSAAYYFPSHDGLYAAAVEAAEELRATCAGTYANALDFRHRPPGRTARLLIEAWYAPDLAEDVVPLRLEPMLSATVTPGLAEVMKSSRPRLIESLAVVLRKSGYEPVADGPDVPLLAMTIDSALLYGAATGDSPIDTAVASVARLLELTSSAAYK